MNVISVHYSELEPDIYCPHCHNGIAFNSPIQPTIKYKAQCPMCMEFIEIKVKSVYEVKKANR